MHSGTEIFFLRGLVRIVECIEFGAEVKNLTSKNIFFNSNDILSRINLAQDV